MRSMTGPCADSCSDYGCRSKAVTRLRPNDWHWLDPELLRIRILMVSIGQGLPAESEIIVMWAALLRMCKFDGS